MNSKWIVISALAVWFIAQSNTALYAEESTPNGNLTDKERRMVDKASVKFRTDPAKRVQMIEILTKYVEKKRLSPKNKALLLSLREKLKEKSWIKAYYPYRKDYDFLVQEDSQWFAIVIKDGKYGRIDTNGKAPCVLGECGMPIGWTGDLLRIKDAEAEKNMEPTEYPRILLNGIYEIRSKKDAEQTMRIWYVDGLGNTLMVKNTDNPLKVTGGDLCDKRYVYEETSEGKTLYGADFQPILSVWREDELFCGKRWLLTARKNGMVQFYREEWMQLLFETKGEMGDIMDNAFMVMEKYGVSHTFYDASFRKIKTYKYAYCSSGPSCVVTNGTKFSPRWLVNGDGKQILEPKYAHAQQLKNGWSIATYGDVSNPDFHVSLHDESGRKIQDFYGKIESINEDTGLAILIHKGKAKDQFVWSAIRMQDGKTILWTRTDRMEFYGDDIIACRAANDGTGNSECDWYDKTGATIQSKDGGCADQKIQDWRRSDCQYRIKSTIRDNAMWYRLVGSDGQTVGEDNSQYYKLIEKWKFYRSSAKSPLWEIFDAENGATNVISLPEDETIESEKTLRPWGGYSIGRAFLIIKDTSGERSIVIYPDGYAKPVKEITSAVLGF